MYEIVHGSIFDKKCDVIIIPCNHQGGMTRTVQHDLIANKITTFPKVSEPGDVVFEENIKDFTNSMVVGFAATVNSFTRQCQKSYLYSICEKILLYCKDNSLTIVNVPLLGAGHGGLSAQESFEILASYFDKDECVILKIFVPAENIYNRLLNDNKISNITIKSPRVFISYASNNPDNKKWVRALACKLLENGVDARIDQFHLKPGNDLPQWMTNEVMMADKIILVCDKYYAKKADSRNGGVGWETMIIQGSMMADTRTDRIIFINREKVFSDGMPTYARTKYSLQWTEPDIPEDEFKDLLCHLFNCDIAPEMDDIPLDIRKKLYKMEQRK